MKVVSKEMESDGSKYIVYLIDDTGRPLEATIVGKDEKKETIENLLSEHFTPEDWVNNKEHLLSKVEEVPYQEYINQ